MIDVKEILKKHEVPQVAWKKFELVAKDLITEVLKEAAENAKINHVPNKGFIPCIFNVNKESITSVINKVKF